MGNRPRVMTQYRKRFNRCFRPCGCRDSVIPRDPTVQDHFCIDPPRHAGLCTFIGPCMKNQLGETAVPPPTAPVAYEGAFA